MSLERFQFKGTGSCPRQHPDCPVMNKTIIEVDVVMRNGVYYSSNSNDEYRLFSNPYGSGGSWASCSICLSHREVEKIL